MNTHFIKCIRAEAIKQHKSNYHTSLMYFSMLVWPILQLLTSYYTYKPFQNTAMGEAVSKWVGQDKIFAFILFGYMGYTFFRCFVQSAWRFTFERTAGTLELIYLTPSSRLGVVLGNAASSLFESVWMFSVFCVGAVVLFTDTRIAGFHMLITAIMALVIPSICWGVFLNSLFLFTRDSAFLFTILEDPMELFGGSKVPFAAFPLWAKAIGSIFPLTWSLSVIREIFMHRAVLSDIKSELLILVLVCTVLLILTMLLLSKGEQYARKTGNMALF